MLPIPRSQERGVGPRLGNWPLTRTDGSCYHSFCEGPLATTLQQPPPIRNKAGDNWLGSRVVAVPVVVAICSLAEVTTQHCTGLCRTDGFLSAHARTTARIKRVRPADGSSWRHIQNNHEEQSSLSTLFCTSSLLRNNKQIFKLTKKYL